MEKKYNSKVDLWLYLLIYISIILPAIPILLIDFNWIVTIFLFVILAALTLYPLGIKYTINGKVLSIHCPFFSTQVIDIFDILLIESTHTLDSSPAASIDRLKLTYKHGCVIISPKKKKDFVNHILSINSKVHIKIN